MAEAMARLPGPQQRTRPIGCAHVGATRHHALSARFARVRHPWVEGLRPSAGRRYRAGGPDPDTELSTTDGAAEANATPAKPLLRGWQHAVMFPIALIAGLILVATAPTTAGRVSSAVFAFTAVLLFGVSALLHRGTWSHAAEALVRRFDHANIYLIIAGTYTPFAVLSLPESQGKLLLIIVWSGAIAGALFRLFWLSAPRWLSTALYVIVGWVVVFFLPELIDGAGVAVVVLIATGGILYTLGAIVYATRWPDPSARAFGFHEVFHSLTIAAFTVHYIAVWVVVHG